MPTRTATVHKETLVFIAAGISSLSYLGPALKTLEYQ